MILVKSGSAPRTLTNPFKCCIIVLYQETLFHIMKPNQTPSKFSRQYNIQVIQRAFNILNELLEERTPLNLEQICTRTHLAKTTAFRIIMNLIAAEMLVETPEGYWLGVKNMRLGALVEEKLDFVHAARPH